MQAKAGNGVQGMDEDWGGGWGLGVGAGRGQGGSRSIRWMDQKRVRTPARRFLAAERSNQTHFRAITLVTNVARRRQSRGREDHYLPRTRTVVPSLKQQFVSERCYSDREGGHYDCHYLALRPLSLQESDGPGLLSQKLRSQLEQGKVLILFPSSTARTAGQRKKKEGKKDLKSPSIWSTPNDDIHSCKSISWLAQRPGRLHTCHSPTLYNAPSHWGN